MFIFFISVGFQNAHADEFPSFNLHLQITGPRDHGVFEHFHPTHGFNNQIHGTANRLKIELGILKEPAARLFMLIQLMTFASDLFTVNSDDNNIKRFWKMTAQLPRELQMIVANRVYSFSETFIAESDLAKACRWLEDIF